MGGVTNMKALLYTAAKQALKFNLPLNGWNVAAVTDMSEMFYGAKVFDQDLNAWDVGSATKLTSMFRGTSLFNQDLSAWDVGSQNFANVPGVEADYGMLSGPITNMFVSTAMSDCNKKTIHNKMDKDITTRSLKD